MKIIAISNHKGGVGKTTSTANIGAALAMKGFKTLLVDIDPQCNLSSHFGFHDPEKNIYESLMAGTPIPIYQVNEKLYLTPSSLDLAAADVDLSQQMMRESILKKLLATIKKDFDFVLIDCPPSLGLLPINAFTAADGILIPVQPEIFSTKGIQRLLEVVGKVREAINPDLKIAGVFTTAFDNRLVIHRDIADDLSLVFASNEIFATKIRRNVALSEAVAKETNIFEYAPKSTGAEDYLSLTEEFLKRHR